jgi:hypothetical protein
MRVKDVSQLPSSFLEFGLVGFGVGGVDRCCRARRFVVDKISIIIIETRDLGHSECR